MTILGKAWQPRVHLSFEKLWKSLKQAKVHALLFKRLHSNIPEESSHLPLPQTEILTARYEESSAVRTLLTSSDNRNGT